MWVLDKQLKLPGDASSQGSCCAQRETFTPRSLTDASVWIYDTCHLELKASLLRFFCSTQENHFGVCLNARMAQETKPNKLLSPPVYLLIIHVTIHNSRLRCRWGTIEQCNGFPHGSSSDTLTESCPLLSFLLGKMIYSLGSLLGVQLALSLGLGVAA